MHYLIGIENNIEARSLAWVLEYPGCFAYGTTGAAALQAAPAAIQEYHRWMNQHNNESTLPDGEIDVQLIETFEGYIIDENFALASEGYEVNAWFRHDWKPLTEEDITQGLKLLAWSRTDLLKAIAGLDLEQLERRYPGERWSIAGILGHVGGADWWYLDRLGLAFPRQQVPEEPFARLATIRGHLEKRLPELAGSQQVVGVDGEFWSPRKLLRRAVWHERDHTEHIHRLLMLSGLR